MLVQNRLYFDVISVESYIFDLVAGFCQRSSPMDLNLLTLCYSTGRKIFSVNTCGGQVLIPYLRQFYQSKLNTAGCYPASSFEGGI